jgi:hypothetical protein
MPIFFFHSAERLRNDLSKRDNCQHNSTELKGEQGDHIGRIVAYWAIVYNEQFLKITEVIQNFKALICTKKGMQ